jgi:hypothetical protein
LPSLHVIGNFGSILFSFSSYPVPGRALSIKGEEVKSEVNFFKTAGMDAFARRMPGHEVFISSVDKRREIFFLKSKYLRGLLVI